ncbi:MAG: hypothetical protein M1837_004692 [Sclerophora amabilis]|nr:MAG: hypothetical protein M1837_004692 [Sclerophora amabilis]
MQRGHENPIQFHSRFYGTAFASVPKARLLIGRHLRLSKSTLTEQHTLPRSSSADFTTIPAEAGLAFPSADPNDQFILSPLLTLPPAFGAAHVGETFSCTLCANNELSQGSPRAIASVRVVAEMQTPSQSLPLDLIPESDEVAGTGLEPGQSSQKIIRYELKEEGNHVLVVTVTYTETAMSTADDSETGAKTAASGRVRTFRKLYQFMAQQCLTVRTKAAELPSVLAPMKKGAVAERQSDLMRFVLEAQLENLGEGSLVLETVTLIPKEPFKSSSLNWDVSTVEEEKPPPPVLNPNDVRQVAFLMEQQPQDPEGQNASPAALTENGRITLGQLSIEWRSAMGDRGSLSTGWLTARNR